MSVIKTSVDLFNIWTQYITPLSLPQKHKNNIYTICIVSVHNDSTLSSKIVDLLSVSGNKTNISF